MIKFAKYTGYGLLVLVAFAIALAWMGGAINWNQEPPYKLVHSWGGKGSGPGQFNDPTGIAVSDDEVFVSDARNSRIQVFDKQGNFKRAFGQGQLGRPMNLDIADGKLYVPDYFKDVIHIFTLGGVYQQAITAEDGFNSPGGVAVRPDGTLLVADTYAQRLVHLQPDGTVLRTWSGAGIGNGEFSYPTDVAIRADGGFYVADGYNDRIQQFGPDGQFLRKWGGPFGVNIFGPFKGWFATVASLAIGPDNNVYTADFYNDRVQKFTAHGDFLTEFSVASASGPGHSVIAVAVGADGMAYIANYQRNRIEKWRPPPR